MQKETVAQRKISDAKKKIKKKNQKIRDQRDQTVINVHSEQEEQSQELLLINWQ